MYSYVIIVKIIITMITTIIQLHHIHDKGDANDNHKYNNFFLLMCNSCQIKDKNVKHKE